MNKRITIIIITDNVLHLKEKRQRQKKKKRQTESARKKVIDLESHTRTKEWKALVIKFYREYTHTHTLTRICIIFTAELVLYFLRMINHTQFLELLSIIKRMIGASVFFLDINTFSMDIQIVFSLY